MKNILIVGFGGFIGSVLRFKLGGLILHHAVDWKFPVSTLVVNVLGCLVAGILAGLVEEHELFTPQTRLLIFTGLLGGFTTFSAFGLETVYLIQRHEHWMAFANVALSVVAGISSLWIGLKLAS